MTSMRSILVTTGVAALMAAGADSAVAAGTVERSFDAFGPDGAPTVPVRKYGRADTCSSSFVNTQPTALRCFSGNLIRDPCFIDPRDGDRAVCVESPSARASVSLRSIRDADDGSRNDVPVPAPWALDLRGGISCVYASGASATRQGKRLNYYCEDRRYLWGSPNRSTSTWTILRSRTFSGRGWKRAQVAVAWR